MNSLPQGTYGRPMPRALWWSKEEDGFL